MRLVKTAGVWADVCPKCGGVALDPGELRTFKSIGHNAATRTNDVLDVISSVVTLADILNLLC